MERFVKIKIVSDDLISKYCGKECIFLEDFYDTCQLFRVELDGDDEKDVYFRCPSCLENEVI